MRLLLLVPLLLALGTQAALAADPEPAAAQSAAASAASVEEAPKFQCRMENDIGSLRMHKVCTKVPTDAERRELQDALRQNLPNNNLTHPAAGSGH